MARREIEGDWVFGWPDRKRAEIMPSKDVEGRGHLRRSPVLDLEGLITPVDAYYVIAQLDMPDPIHPDDYTRFPLAVRSRTRRSTCWRTYASFRREPCVP